MNICWLYIEPFVHISINKDEALLYNTLNGMHLKYSQKERPYKLIEQLNNDVNLLVIELSEEYLKLSEVNNFIEKLRDTYIGDIIYSNAQKPIQIKPIFNIQKDIKTIIDSEKSFVGTKIMQELSDITIFINDYCSLDCSNCQNMYKQIPHCSKNSDQKKELDLRIIERIKNDLQTTINSINISGGNILKYSDLIGLCDLFNLSKIIPTFYIYYKNIIAEPVNVLATLVQYDFRFNVLINSSINASEMSKISDLLGVEKITFTYILTDIADMEIAPILLGNIDNYIILPFYDGKNLNFFQRNVFINEKEILKGKLSMSEIYSRKVVNSFFYGKLQIMSNGNVYANINEDCIGNIEKQSLQEIAHKAMLEGLSWRKTRESVLPCKECLYKYLCPPISNYEYSIGRYNLCKTKNYVHKPID